MWHYTLHEVERGVSKYRFLYSDSPLTNAEVLSLIGDSEGFREFLTEVLKSSPYASFFFEVKPLNSHTLNDIFECVLVNAPVLSTLTANNAAFRSYFKQGEYVTSFFNLNQDARLVVPVSLNNALNYSHISQFLNNAPRQQINVFWQKVGEEIKTCISDQLIWVSTSGLGVHWLHLRIDSMPKYYHYLPYKNMRG